MITAVLFDLDGVLINSLTSIQASMNVALAALDRPTLSREETRPMIGPPLAKSVPRLLKTDDAALIDRFIAVYREHYRQHSAETTEAMPGLRSVIPRLAERWPLAVATSKPEAYARPLLEHFAVAGAFRAICGGSLEHHRDTKATIIGRALRALDRSSSEGLIMVGDRSYDVVGAATHGIPTIGATYGMGGAEELREAGARWCIDSLAQLEELLPRLDASSPPR